MTLPHDRIGVKVKTLEMEENKIRHVALIMDGNNRWAKENSKTTFEGHKKGADTCKDILVSSLELGIPYVSFFAFSNENWGRPEEEINNLLSLLDEYIKIFDSSNSVSSEENINLSNTFQGLNLNKSKVDELSSKVKLKVLGDLSKLPERTKAQVENICQQTSENSSMTCAVCFSYGSQQEITQVCSRIVEERMKSGNVDAVSKEEFEKYMYDSEMPPVDILIRTSGVQRLSNFLLYQSAYAEIFFIKKLWPDFNNRDLENILDEYKTIKRNFGKR
eukprot:snap_masked-scaffold_3-processed-gene-2.19-mRNA-1 protein AED:0.04 eAED:0.10 QI:0/-1/0/1/-1/1/1/0/275